MEKSDNIICNVCGEDDLIKILHLPEYPLNSLFTNEPTQDGIKADFDLYQCSKCKHIQGFTPISPMNIYKDNYNFQDTAGGVIKRKALFLEHILENFKDIEFNRVIDIGCNNLSLLLSLKQKGIKAKYFIGIDPVSLSENNTMDQEIRFIEGFAEDVEIPYFDPHMSDLIISDQTFEHIPKVNIMLKEFSRKVGANSVFVIGVPSLELIMKHQYFHMLIHEHVNYFTEISLTNLFTQSNPDFSRLTSKLIKLPHGGTLIQSFRLTVGKKVSEPLGKYNPLIDFQKNFSVYKNQLKVVRDYILDLAKHERIYGFGASYLTANLAYFMESDFSFLTAIIDDTPYKRNKFIPEINPIIVNIEDIVDINNIVFFITAPQTTRPIMNRIIPMNPILIVNPQFIY